MTASRGILIALGITAALSGCAAQRSSQPVDLARGVLAVRMVATPAYIRHVCSRSRLLTAGAACPRELPYVGQQPAWEASICLRGRSGCRGLTWDDLELIHSTVVGGSLKPPNWSHVAVFGGSLTRVAFPFGFPTGGKVVKLRDGLFTQSGTHPLSFGITRWGKKTGMLVLAPDYPRGGEQGGHLIFEWQSSGVSYAIGLHAWEPLLEAAATLRAIVRSARS
jgi:hypothetical protein